MSDLGATDVAGHVFAGWAMREANMRTVLAADGPVHVRLGEAPWINVLNDGAEVLYHAGIVQLTRRQGGDTVPAC